MEDYRMSEAENEKVLQEMGATIGRMRVEALAQSAGAVDPKAVAEVVAKNSKYEIDAQGAVKIQMIDSATGEKLRTASGEDMTPGQFIAQMKADPDHGWRFTDGAAGKPKDKPTNGIATETNPWMPATWNLTEQGRLLRTAPEFAARLQAAAKGLRPENPWSKEGFNLTRISEIERDDPALAARMKAEVASPGHDNPWVAGAGFNMTKQVILVRSNKTLADKLKAEAKAINGPDKPKSYIFTPPPGSFKRMGTGN
jgi:hypothetical protein